MWTGEKKIQIRYVWTRFPDTFRQGLIAFNLKVLLRRKFLFSFQSLFNINLLYMFKIIHIAKNWNDTCVRGLEISH